ncbi:glycosyltransferase family 4 protein [Rathayibacter sp. VKM Ac-2760]|uniref:glycosyltransferase family 4 protein n=1 Tax=Rathayibacter sp. VKM Ac-2760 TaxID=2609253 RepID=UPI0013176CF9|nr:glycosyltransferase family 4 protein [Rathayibacter sp. VKM Ac-2760]QHC60066.1 glycosyltransferase [Rathayibacter sp. VKM Ac-2760]
MTRARDDSRPLRILGLFLKHSSILARPGEPYLRGRLPYRADLLRDSETRLLAKGHAARPAHVKLRDVAEHRSGLALDTQLRSLRAVASADAVLAVLEPEAEFPALLRRAGLPPYARTPLVVLSCWWAEELRTGTPERRRRVLRAAAGVDRILVLSANQREVFARHGVDERRVVPIGFGVDADYYAPGPERPKRFEVLAAGVDRGRDFGTLVAAAARLPHRRFDLFTMPERIAGLALPPNVLLHAPVPVGEHRENLRDAALVVVPTHERAYPTGQSVLLEASGCGTAVAVTRTAAMADYLDDGVTALGLPLHDPAGVAAVIEAALGDDPRRARIAEAGRARVLAEANAERMWAEVRAVLREVTGR